MPHKQSQCFKQDKLHSKAKSAYYIKQKKKKYWTNTQVIFTPEKIPLKSVILQNK